MASAVQFLSPSKNVLQQANVNVPAPMEVKGEKETSRRRRRLPQETENRASPASAGKLRRGRPEVSSQKLGVQNASYGYCRFSSDETGDEDEEDEEDAEVEDGDGDDEGAGYGRKVRKPAQRPIIPNYVTKSDKGQYRKRRKSRGDGVDFSSQREGKAQASVSIAKRNARERNRVKLVNQGFATLRSRIPDYISEIYTEEKKKKKVSKVETLRMALGYIRHLTDMLELRTGDPSEWFRIKGEDSSTGYPSPADTEYQQSPSADGGGVYGSRDTAFYDYDLELDSVKDLSVRSGDREDEEVLLQDAQFRDEKETLILSESAFSVDVGCCYELVKPEEGEEPKKTPPLPSITESFPKKSLRAFYEAPPFLSGSSAFHV